MERVIDCIIFGHDLRIVAIAAVVCAFACFTTFLVVEQARRDSGRRRMLWLSAGGVGVWFSLSDRRLSKLLAATILGAGISTMHYVGMAAMIMPDRMILDRWFVIASVLVSVIFSFAALVVRERRVERDSHILPWPASALFALAICGMHFTGMSSAMMVPGRPDAIHGTSIGGEGLIAAVFLIAFAILAIGLVTVVEERKIQRQAASQAMRLRCRLSLDLPFYD